MRFGYCQISKAKCPRFDQYTGKVSIQFFQQCFFDGISEKS